MPRSASRPGRAPLRDQIAASIDLPSELLPHVSDLFAGLDSLGSSPRIVTNMLAGARLEASTRVLDLACGKGAAAVSVAARFGWRVTGIDACEPFIESARQLAARRGVAHLCTFRRGDVRRAPRGPFDAAIMLGLFPVDRAAPLLRSRVRRGGVYLIDDALRDERFRPMPASLRDAPTRRDLYALIEGFGDTIIAERLVTPSQTTRLEALIQRALSRRADEIARRLPSLRPRLRAFLDRQREAALLLRGPLRPGIWLIRRGG